jgi:hypothetical protein
VGACICSLVGVVITVSVVLPMVVSPLSLPLVECLKFGIHDVRCKTERRKRWEANSGMNSHNTATVRIRLEHREEVVAIDLPWSIGVDGLRDETSG